MRTFEWCNWSFDECLVRNNKWLVKRDCSDEPIKLLRGSGRNWSAYQSSLQPVRQFNEPPLHSKCPNCGKYVNGVNPSDDGETWRE